MRGIIYETMQEASDALAACESIDQGDIQVIGQDERRPVKVTPKPYTYIKPHPNKPLFAIVADEKVEEVLNRESEELPADWFEPVNQDNYGKE